MTTGRDDVAIVLVHGACHGAWCWEDVAPALSGRGWTVSTVELPLTSFEDDTETVRREVGRHKRAARAVLLVGHSYGGIVISAAGHGSDRLVYAAAVVPNAGEAVATGNTEHRTPETDRAFVVSDDAVSAVLDPVQAVRAFFGRCSPEQQRRAVERLRPIALSCLQTPVDDPAWRSVPASYIVCADDHALLVSYQRDRAQALGESIEFDCDHSLFYSATDALVTYLDAGASVLSETWR